MIFFVYAHIFIGRFVPSLLVGLDDPVVGLLLPDALEGVRALLRPLITCGEAAAALRPGGC